MPIITLNPGEIAILNRQNPTSAQDGGWQTLLVRLQENLNGATGELDLGAQDLEQIPRYAFDYGNGGWEGDGHR